jgi:hypothetical protein
LVLLKSLSLSLTIINLNTRSILGGALRSVLNSRGLIQFVEVSHLIFIVLFMAVISAKHQTGFDTHENRYANKKADQKVRTNSFSITHVFVGEGIG